MLILLPPSEGKARPRRGRSVDLGTLTFPELTATRERVLDTLVRLCREDADKARDVLGLTPGLAGEVAVDAGLRTAPTLPAERLYTGVLYDALDIASLEGAALRRARASVVVVSGLWGALRLGDRVPAYRLSMSVDLPGVGPLAAAWREPLAQALRPAAGPGLVVDLRSSTYAAAWRPNGDVAARTVAVSVLREHAGTRTVVSHMAKHYRGLLARAVVERPGQLTRPEALAEVAESAGWRAELHRPTRAGAGWRLDLVVAE